MTSRTQDEFPDPPSGKTGWPWSVERNWGPAEENSSLPKITVITPSYMQGQFLEETIRSVLLQGYPNLEYIIMDGGSTDESVAIIRKYEPWLAHWECQKDAGQSDAINKGLRRATGEIVAYLNSDDWYHPGALNAIAQRSVTHPEEKWWVGWVDVCLEGSESKDRKLSQFTSMERFLGRAETLYQPGVFWRRELLEKVPAFDPEYHFAFDHEYWVKLLCHGFKPVSLDVPVANFRLHSLSKTCSKQYLFMKELWEVAENHRHLFNASRWSETCRFLEEYEAGYLLDTIYSLLAQNKRGVALKYLLGRLPLAARITPRKAYFGAWYRTIITGHPPAWFSP